MKRATPRPGPAYNPDVRRNDRDLVAPLGGAMLAALLLVAAASPARAQDATGAEPAIGSAIGAPDGTVDDRDDAAVVGAPEPAPDPREARAERARQRQREARDRAAEAQRDRARRRKDLEERSRAEAAERQARAAEDPARQLPPLEGGPDQLVVHLIMLEDRILETQQQMLVHLAETMAALENDQAVDRKAAVRKAVGFNVRLRHLERQIPRLEAALERIRGEVSGSGLAELQLRRELIHRNMRQISEEHQRVVDAYKDRRGDEELEEELEMLEEDPPSDELELPDAPGEEPAPAPETTEEAAELLEVGEVRTPRHLTELFERIPETETPRGSLRRYRDYIR